MADHGESWQRKRIGVILDFLPLAGEYTKRSNAGSKDVRKYEMDAFG